MAAPSSAAMDLQEDPEDRPPMSVVFVRDQPASSRHAETFAFQEDSSAMQPPPVAAAFSSTASAPPRQNFFKLQPRRPILCTPSPSRGADTGACRGRKRRAPPPTSASSSSAASSSNSFVGGKEDATSFQHSPKEFALQKNTIGEQSPRVESTLQGLKSLSLQHFKRKAAATTEGTALETTFRNAPAVSSGFSAFASPPGSIGGESPSHVSAMASNRSQSASPKIAPLRVLTSGQSRTLAPSGVASKLPPRHTANPSSLLFSLDGKEEEKDGEDDDGAECLLTPSSKSLPSTVFCPPPKVSNDGGTPCKRGRVEDSNRNQFTSPARGAFANASPLQMPFSSPGVMSPRVIQRSSPRTPLPRVTLTPRSGTMNRSATHRPTPLGGNPDFGALEFSLAGAPWSTAEPNTVAWAAPPIDERLALPRPTANAGSSIFAAVHGSSNSLALSVDASDQGITNTPPPRNKLKQAEEEQACHKLQSTLSTNANDIKTRSLLRPSRSANGLLAMLESELPDDVATADSLGSLSDDEQDDFMILVAPGVIAEERQAALESRQRKRRSLDRASGPSFRSTESFSTNGKRDSSGSLQRFQSEGSLADLGLKLESNPSGRDLATPPAILPVPQCPPPLLPRDGTTPSSQKDSSRMKKVCIANADSRSVSRAIAEMAYQSQHGESPRLAQH